MFVFGLVRRGHTPAALARKAQRLERKQDRVFAAFDRIESAVKRMADAAWRRHERAFDKHDDRVRAAIADRGAVIRTMSDEIAQLNHLFTDLLYEKSE